MFDAPTCAAKRLALAREASERVREADEAQARAVADARAVAALEAKLRKLQSFHEAGALDAAEYRAQVEAAAEAAGVNVVALVSPELVAHAIRGTAAGRCRQAGRQRRQGGGPGAGGAASPSSRGGGKGCGGRGGGGARRAER